MKIVFMGFATSYKSTVGKLVSEKLNIPFADVDTVVEQRAGMKISEIFRRYGEQHFRNLENDVILQLAQQDNLVVACGGGSVLAENFPKLAQSGTVVWLKVSAPTVQSRLTDGRPLFDGISFIKLQNHIAVREGLYRPYADVSVDTDGKTSQQVADEVLTLLDAAPAVR